MLSRTVMIVIAALATSALGATPIGCPGDGSLMLLIVRPGAAIEAVDLSWSGGGSQGLFSDDKTEHVFMMYESGDFQPAGVAKAKVSTYLLLDILILTMPPNHTRR